MKRRRLTQDVSRVLAEVVDLARVWGIIGAGHVASERQRLRDLLDGAKDVTASCEVKVSRLAFRSLVGELGHADARAFGKALGRAMPWWSAHREVRTVEMREKWYGALWRKYLEDEHVDAAALASIAERTLKPHFYDLALDEGQALLETAIAPITVAGLAYHNRSLRRKWAEASEAALAVSNAIASHGSHAAVRAGMKRMRVLGEQQHWTRAVGAYTARLLESRPFLASDVDRVMSIKYTKNGTSQVELVTAAS